MRQIRPEREVEILAEARSSGALPMQWPRQERTTQRELDHPRQRPDICVGPQLAPGYRVGQQLFVTVEVDGGVVSVVTPTSREHYRVVDRDNWVYRMDLSTDGGRSWNEGQVEMTFRRLE